MINLRTAGESHGQALVGIIEGLPAKLYIDEDLINRELARRQMGYGRSSRMKLERDRIEIISGLDRGYTTGSPIALMIANRGTNVKTEEVYNVRPGHADLVGAIKYNHPGGRNPLERASARETAMRVALGSFCRLYLREFDIEVASHIIAIGKTESSLDYYRGLDFESLKRADESEIRVIDREAEARMIGAIGQAQEEGDTLGGLIEIVVRNLPLGLGSYNSWENKLDANLAYGLMSIQGIKSVEIGLGREAGSRLGSEFHDEIFYNKEDKKYFRSSNNAGGIEAGVSNGEDLVIRVAMKPIPTLRKGLRTVNIESKEGYTSSYERSDVCAVPAASIVCESVVSHIISGFLKDLLGGDFLELQKDRYRSYLDYIEKR